VKKLLLLLLAICLTGSFAFAQDSVKVTFQVDLRIKAAEGIFVPGTDGVSIRGSFMDEAGMDGDWFPSQGAFWLSDADGDTIYSATIPIDSNSAGTLFEYKYQINDAIWEGDPNRKFTLSSTDMVLPVDLFDRDSVINIQVINTINFTADLTEIYGSGLGFFDPDADVLKLMGLDWVGATVVEEGSDRTFVEDAFSPGIFHATMVIKGVEGDQTKWKCKAEPEDHFFNWGWEITPDYWFTIQEDGYVADITVKPNIFPVQPPLSEEVSILFQVDMNDAYNFYTGEKIDPSTLQWVGLKGQNSVLGSWGGDWLPSDTVSGEAKTMHVLNDDGKNGDKSAGDNIYSLLITFPVGNDGGPSLYKYGAFYTGADTINGGYHPLDNEMQGTDHWVNVKIGGTTEVMDYFGLLEAPTAISDRTGSVPEKIRLTQNYPNPFNPVTTINYYLPNNEQVELSVYNVLGQKVLTLSDGAQKAGWHSVRLNAADMASGVYFYRLATSNRVFTKKMLLIK